MFHGIVDKVRHRTRSWTGSHLTQAGKEIMLKTVAIAMPVYSMSCFKIPRQVVNEITAELRRFWWEKKAEHRGISWVAWDRLQLPKDEGGIGFKDLFNFNDALLAKQAWRLLQHPDSLFARLFKAKYYPHCSLLEATSQRLQSYGWSSILVGLNLLKQGLTHNIGDGLSVRIYADNWLPAIPPRPAVGDNSSSLTVNSLITVHNNIKSWNEDALQQALTDEDRILAQSLFLSSSVQDDTPIWAMEASGIYSVKSGYHLARQLDPGIMNILPPHGDIRLKRRIWKLPIIPKMKHFLWNILSRALPTATRLCSRGMNISPICTRCQGQPETLSHLFFDCPVSQTFWSISALRQFTWLEDQDEDMNANITQLLDRFILPGLSNLEKQLPIWILWHIWISRNALVFSNKPIHPDREVSYCLDEVNEWLSVSQQLNRDSPANGQALQVSWKRPSPLYVKCNFDAAYDPVSGHSFAGWIIRDHQATVICWGSASLGITSSPLEAEGKALLAALRDILSRGFTRVNFEGDCQVLIRCLNSEHKDWSIHNLITEIKMKGGALTGVLFSFTHRTGNRAAHEIASSRQIYRSVYHNPFIPVWLLNIVQKDSVNSFH